MPHTASPVSQLMLLSNGLVATKVEFDAGSEGDERGGDAVEDL